MSRKILIYMIFIPISVFSQKTVFNGYASVNSVFDGTISKDTLISKGKLFIMNNNSHYKIKDYNILTFNRAGKMRSMIGKNDYFTSEIKSNFDSIPLGKVIYIRNIRVELADKSTIKLNPIRLRLDNNSILDTSLLSPYLKASVAGISDGVISKTKFLETKTVELNNSDFKIVNYNFTITNYKHYWIDFWHSNDSITKHDKEYIQQLDSKSLVILSEITAKDKRGKFYHLPIIILEIE